MPEITTKTLADTIQDVAINELRDLVFTKNKGGRMISPFIKFQLLLTTIDFLGACIDEHDLEPTKNEREIYEARFDLALNTLFDNKYKFCTDKGNKYYLKRNLRNPMIHRFGHNKYVGLTERHHLENENVHLSISTDKCLIFVLEDFCNDVISAAQKLLRDRKNYSEFVQNKLSQEYITIKYKKVKINYLTELTPLDNLNYSNLVHDPSSVFQASGMTNIPKTDDPLPKYNSTLKK